MTEDGRRIGRGPWSRLFASVVVGDEGSRTAERGRRLVPSVEELRVDAGALEARVEGCVVTIAAEPVPPRVWSAIVRFARGNHRLEAGVNGREQSVHLMHLMEIDWDEPLIPRANAITRACTCGDEAHVAAAAYAAAQRMDEEPALLLRWRGRTEQAEPEQPEPGQAAEPAPVPVPADAWRAGELPLPQEPRALPVAAVLKRLGPSGIEVGDADLVAVLERAYAAFSRPG